MKKVFAWSEWSVTTKILVPFLALSVVSLAVIAIIALANLRGLSRYALESSISLGESAIEDSTAHLNRLGEETISQKAGDVAKQVEMYLAARPPMTVAEMREDAGLRAIVVQPVGTTGYTTLIDPVNALIIIHKFPGQEKDISPLAATLPSFWGLIESSTSGETAAGYYDWLEVDGAIREKYAGISPVKTPGGETLTLWATTYIEEFSLPVVETEREINAAIAESRDFINNNVSTLQNLLIIVLIVMILVVALLALLLSRAITRPILSLKQGAEEIGRGELGYKLEIKNRDELGELANSFNKMGADLQNYIEELKKAAAESIGKEKIIQENMRLYIQKVGQAQEDERKRIARELHDETVQSLVVISRHLDDLASGRSRLSAADIREEVRKVAGEVRRFSQELRPSILDDLGLIPAVKWLASELTGNYGITVKTRIEGKQRQLTADAELMLFRIVQEALTNVGRHSGATEALVTVAFSAEKVKVAVKDNGKGIGELSGVRDLTRAGKLGMAGMQERTQLLGGRFEVESRPGGGTVLTVEIPV